MSASILWKPVSDDGRNISVYAPSAFMTAMERAGMELPCTIGPSNLEVLRGMSATWGKGEDSPNPYEQIIAAINGTNGDIELWAVQ